MLISDAAAGQQLNPMQAAQHGIIPGRPALLSDGDGRGVFAGEPRPGGLALAAILQLHLGGHVVHAALVVGVIEAIGQPHGKPLQGAGEFALRPGCGQFGADADFFFQVIKVGNDRLIRVAVAHVQGGGIVAGVNLIVDQHFFHGVNLVPGQGVEQIEILLCARAFDVPGDQGRGDHEPPVEHGQGCAFGQGVALRLPRIGRRAAQGVLPAAAEVGRLGFERAGNKLPAQGHDAHAGQAAGYAAGIAGAGG